MESEEHQYILNELVRMEPQLEDAPWEEHYRRCHEVCARLPGDCQDWILVEFLDPVTFAARWFWRRKI